MASPANASQGHLTPAQARALVFSFTPATEWRCQRAGSRGRCDSSVRRVFFTTNNHKTSMPCWLFGQHRLHLFDFTGLIRDDGGNERLEFCMFCVGERLGGHRECALVVIDHRIEPTDVVRNCRIV